MKIIFLDVDGVLNNYATMQRFHGCIGINPKLVAHIRRIIKETGCSVVLSSTWRLDPPFRAEVRKRVCDFIDVTPNFGGGGKVTDCGRGNEILDWLSHHPEVTKHAILDDDMDFHSHQPLFRTSMRTGVTKEIADEVIKYLNEDCKNA